MKNKVYRRILSLFLCLVTVLPLCVPAFADNTLTTGENGLALVEDAEGFRANVYESGGKYYIGYGTECDPLDYPGGIAREEAELLLREKLQKYESRVNDFFAHYGIVPTQGQFDALISFSYNFGTGWMSGTSALAKIARGEVSATRLEVAQAFGEWCHSGGAAKSGLAQRRLKEAALYLDGVFMIAENEFVYLIISKEDGVTYETDFRVYTRGLPYTAFPTMERAGCRLSGLQNTSGALLTESSIASGNAVVTAVWAKNEYTGTRFSDVTSDNWFYDCVMELSQQGIINGNPDGTFAPNRAITAGETLKLVLLATGHSAQAATSDHWASGYGSYALSMGYLTAAEVSDLGGAMSRLNVVRLAAKALGYGASVSASPFTDVNDGYVTALYEAGVITGSLDGGVIRFKPQSSITRAEVAAIVYRIYQLAKTDKKQTITYNSYTVDVLTGVPTNTYEKSAFYRDGSVMHYTAGQTMLGIDVSRFQGDIDWEAVRKSGVEFAIIRAGGRYYTKDEEREEDSDPIYLDAKFDENMRGALNAGLRVGVYFFSQAITAEEAREEAQIVLDMIAPYRVTGPVVFDWEVIGKEEARTYGIATQTLCDCANTFCSIIEKAGYSPMIYFNKYAGYIKYDLSKVLNYDFWFAEYDVDAPSFYYDFQMWQYTSKGQVDGIEGNVDMDIWFL